MKTVWILSDGLPGHYNQSLGISIALQQHMPHEVVMIDVNLRFKFLRSLMRFIANHVTSIANLKAFFFFYHHSKLPPEEPALIISSGGNTIFANISLSRTYHSKSVFSGTNKGYTCSLIDLIFTTTPVKNTNNNIVLDLPPANIEPGSISGKKNIYTLLIGGNGAGYSFNNEEWKLLAKNIVHISQRDGIHWNITTSRRTGRRSEELLQKNIDDSVIAKAVWFGSEPEKVVRHFLDEGQIIFCTEDSLTMISEAIYAHKPVITLQPESMTPIENDSETLKQYQNKNFIKRTALKSMDRLNISRDDFCKSYPDINKKISDSVLSILER